MFSKKPDPQFLICYEHRKAIRFDSAEEYNRHLQTKHSALDTVTEPDFISLERRLRCASCKATFQTESGKEGHERIFHKNLW